jgi:hypothetical protein
LQARLRIEVPMTALFEHPTIATIAGALVAHAARTRAAADVTERARRQVTAVAGLRNRRRTP